MLQIIICIITLIANLNTAAVDTTPTTPVPEPEKTVTKEIETKPATAPVTTIEKTSEKQTETETVTFSDVTTKTISDEPELTFKEPELVFEEPKSVLEEPELTLEEQYEQQGYHIVYERPTNESEIYCRPGMTLEEWWEMNPPDDGAYDDWDDENNSPDII